MLTRADQIPRTGGAGPWEKLSDHDPGLRDDTAGALIYTIMKVCPGYFGSADASLELHHVEHYSRVLSEAERAAIRRSFGLV